MFLWPIFHHHSSALPLLFRCLHPPLRTCDITWSPLTSFSQLISNSNFIGNLNCSLPHNKTYSQILETRLWTSFREPLFCLPTPLLPILPCLLTWLTPPRPQHPSLLQDTFQIFPPWESLPYLQHGSFTILVTLYCHSCHPPQKATSSRPLLSNFLCPTLPSTAHPEGYHSA